MAAKKSKRKNVTKSPGRPYETGLDRVAANYQPLTPLSFLERAAKVFPRHTAIIHGRQRTDYATFYARSRRLASALAGKGIRKGDTVAVLLANTPPMLEAHYGVPMLGAVLNALNTRLDPATIAFMLEHGGAKVLITDREGRIGNTVERGDTAGARRNATRRAGGFCVVSSSQGLSVFPIRGAPPSLASRLDARRCGVRAGERFTGPFA
ncbi:MAG TPA: AMP-binding protein, partial [Rhizomicrobium sp.]